MVDAAGGFLVGFHEFSVHLGFAGAGSWGAVGVVGVASEEVTGAAGGAFDDEFHVGVVLIAEAEAEARGGVFCVAFEEG